MKKNFGCIAPGTLKPGIWQPYPSFRPIEGWAYVRKPLTGAFYRKGELRVDGKFFLKGAFRYVMFLLWQPSPRVEWMTEKVVREVIATMLVEDWPVSLAVPQGKSEDDFCYICACLDRKQSPSEAACQAGLSSHG